MIHLNLNFAQVLEVISILLGWILYLHDMLFYFCMNLLGTLLLQHSYIYVWYFWFQETREICYDDHHV